MSYSPQISLLVPIYNVEKYLAECLDSILAQTFSDFEVICINDGSTDRSLEILQKYAKQDQRFSIIDKPNSGYGDSLNLGLLQAKGKYLAIVEPDDWLADNTLAELLRVAKKKNADVVKSNHFSFRCSKSGDQLEKISTFIKNSDPQVVYPKEYPAIFTFPPTIWSALYRYDFLKEHQVEFLPTAGASYQDIGFNLKVWLNNPRTVLVPEAYYHYRLDNSNSSVNNPGKVNCVVDEYHEVFRYLEEHHLDHDFAAIIVACQFRNYLWNLQRLSGQLAKTFYQTFCQAMLDARRKSWLNQEYYSARHWRLLQNLLKHPYLTYRFIRLRAFLWHR